MKRLNTITAFICLMLFAFTGSGNAADSAKKAVKIDTKATLELFKGWGNRKTFPDSASFAYYNAYALLALEGKISPESRTKIIDFLKTCQRKNGGFVSEPKYAKEPNIIYTYYALNTLALLDAAESINRKAALGYVRSLIQKDGGIKARQAGSEKATLDTTYYGLIALHQLKALDTLNSKKTIAFIKSYREKGKGYSKVLKKMSTPETTYKAVKALELLDGLSKDIKADVVNYLKGTRYSGLVKNRKYSRLPAIKEMSYVLATLTELSALKKVNTDKVHEFVESLYIAENGGFGPRPGLGTTPPSTYHGVVCLVHLGKLPDPLKRYKK